MTAIAGGRLPAIRGRDALVPAVLAGCDGAVRGSLVAIAVSLGAWLLGTLALLPWSVATGSRPALSGPVSDTMLAGCCLVPVAFAASRSATAALSWHGSLAMAFAARVVGVVGGLILALLFLLLLRTTALPLMFVAQAAAVAAWVAGAASTLRPGPVLLTVRRWIAVAVAGGLVLFIAWGPVGGRPETGDREWPRDRDLSLIGAALPDGVDPPFGWELTTDGGRLEAWVTWSGDEEVGEDEEDGAVAAPSTAPGWTDARFELWAAQPRETSWSLADERVGDPDQAIAGPIRIVPVEPEARTTPYVVEYDDIRGLREALVVFTAVRDGERYAISDFPVLAAYRATPLEWLLSFAPGSPVVAHPVIP